MTATVKIGLETVVVGDFVAENRTPWIRAIVTEIVADVNEFTGEAITKLTIEWLKSERCGNMIARAGATRRYTVNKYGVSDIRKVS